MTFFLGQRSQNASEHMDDPNCDIKKLHNTYRQFSTINSLISQWRSVYTRRIRPSLHPNKKTTLLDIGFGGGDIPLKLADWASSDGYNLRITAIDPDPRAMDFVQDLENPHNVRFLECALSELITNQNSYDFVISNHLVHHLAPQGLSELLEQVRHLTKEQVIFNDIQRSDWAYLLFNIFSRPISQSSFITADGLTSIKRSYTAAELQSVVSSHWQVTSKFPFRLLLTLKGTYDG